MKKVLDHAFAKLMAAFPDKYSSDQMESLWMHEWQQLPSSIVVRTVDKIIRTWQQFPSLDEFLVECAAEAKSQNRALRREMMEECPKCDTGMVETKPNAFRPCEDCLPEGYEQWVNGNYEPQRF